MTSPSSKREVEVSVTILRETDAAYCVDNGKIKVWIPKSQVTDECEDKGRIISLFVPEWLAYEKGLI